MRNYYLCGVIIIVFVVIIGWINRNEHRNTVPKPLSIVDATNLIDGYPERFSCFQGERVKFFVNCKTVADVHLQLADINDSIVDSVSFYGFAQDPIPQNAYTKGFGYERSFTYRIPRSLHSGLYHWMGTEVWFLVKEKKKSAPIVIVYPSNTEQAYNNAGGKSLYDFNSTSGRSHSVSFERPINYRVLPASDIHDFVKGFLSWIIHAGYDYRLISDQDMDNYQSIGTAKLVIVIGHSEYWSRTARENLDLYNSHGGNIAIFSGNTMWWQVRYARKYNNLICYKDSLGDPVADPRFKTISWGSACLEYPVLNSIGADFAHGGYGSKPDHGWDGYKIIRPDSPLLRGTQLQYGSIVSILTHEFDGTLLKPDTSTWFSDPIPDLSGLGAWRLEIIGYDLGHCHYTGCRSVATFIAYQHTPTSGKIVNTASTDWCNARTIYGKDGLMVQQITRNIIDLLLSDSEIFSDTKNVHN